MGKCVVCGKKGLFLKINSNGLCNVCEEKRIKDEKDKFETYYKNLLEEFVLLKKTIKVDNAPISSTELIPLIENTICRFDKIKENLHNTNYRNLLLEKIVENISFRDDFSRRYGFGNINDWDISIRLKSPMNQVGLDEIICGIDEEIESHKRKLRNKINSILKCAEFQKKIDSIPSFKIQITNTKHNRQTVSELDQKVKYTNITSKMNFDRIGSFVVIDTETTGLSSTKDNLIELAAIKFEDWTPIEKFHTMINPEKHIPEEVSKINNIYDDMVVNSPTFSQVIDSLNIFVGTYNIVGHNLPFDLKFLYRYGYDFTLDKRYYFDTCEISKKILRKPKMKWDKEYSEYVINENYDYDVEDYKLTTLCDYYKIRDNSAAHRALSDAYATGILFEELAKEKMDY